MSQGAPTSPGTPSIPLSAELQALEEVLEIARHDLHTLLTCDHPPPGADILIDHERGVVADLEWLVWDARSRVAMRSFAAMVI